MTTKERPILFSGEMVRAILDGRKTQTRRVIKPQPVLVESSHRWTWPIPANLVRPGCCTSVCTASREWWEYLAPEQWKYKVGDRLWVREAWARIEPYPCVGEDYGLPKVDPFEYGGQDLLDYWRQRVVFRVDDENRIVPRWRPSIHMPRWASRITLEVTGVRVERVQDISASDAESEGVFSVYQFGMPRMEAVNCFHSLWDAINAKRGYGWDANPWVWVIEFKRISL
jgi:hypothetical protein